MAHKLSSSSVGRSLSSVLVSECLVPLNKVVIHTLCTESAPFQGHSNADENLNDSGIPEGEPRSQPNVSTHWENYQTRERERCETHYCRQVLASPTGFLIAWRTIVLVILPQIWNTQKRCPPALASWAIARRPWKGTKRNHLAGQLITHVEDKNSVVFLGSSTRNYRKFEIFDWQSMMHLRFTRQVLSEVCGEKLQVQFRAKPLGDDLPESSAS